MSLRILTIQIQCAIPVFKGLFPAPHNNIIIEMLFELGTWHSMAKLCLHIEPTIQSLETSTTWLGCSLWHFESVTCEAYDTHELPSEEAAWSQWKAVVRMKNGHSQGWLKKPSNMKSTKAKNTKWKFNVSTYKTHALGDYVEAIWWYGTTDNYNTELVSDI